MPNQVLAPPTKEGHMPYEILQITLTLMSSGLLPSEKSIQAQTSRENVEGNITGYVENVVSSIGFGLFQIIAFVLAGMTFVAYVCESLTFAFVGVQVTTLWKINNYVYASVPAATCITNLIGQVIFGYIADKYGRKWPYVCSLFLVGIFVAASSFANNFILFGVFRGIAAIGIGGIFVLKVPILMEFLPIRYRGIVTISTGLIESFVQCAVTGLAWWLVPTYPKGWRYFIMASSVPSFVTGLFLIFFIESPRYLVAHRKTEQAWKVFSFIARFNGKKLDAIVEKDQFFHQIDLLVDKSNRNSKINTSSISKLSTIFKRPYRRRTVCFAIIFTIANCVPFNTTLFLPTYLTDLNLNPYFIVLVGVMAQIPGIALIAIIVEWPEFGRLNTLRIFTFLSIVSLLLFGFIQNVIATPVIIVLVYFSLVPAAGFLSTYMSESYPTEIRVMTVAFMTSIVSINGAWFPFVAGYAVDLSKHRTWISPVYLAALMMVQFIFTLILNHETRGKKLVDVIVHE